MGSIFPNVAPTQTDFEFLAQFIFNCVGQTVKSSRSVSRENMFYIVGKVKNFLFSSYLVIISSNCI